MNPFISALFLGFLLFYVLPIVLITRLSYLDKRKRDLYELHLTFLCICSVTIILAEINLLKSKEPVIGLLSLFLMFPVATCCERNSLPSDEVDIITEMNTIGNIEQYLLKGTRLPLDIIWYIKTFLPTRDYFERELQKKYLWRRKPDIIRKIIPKENERERFRRMIHELIEENNQDDLSPRSGSDSEYDSEGDLSPRSGSDSEYDSEGDLSPRSGSDSYFP